VRTAAGVGSLIVILLWVYYSAQIVFLGAEFTKVYSRRLGDRGKTIEHGRDDAGRRGAPRSNRRGRRRRLE